MHVKSGDTVIVISGKDKGKKGKILKVFPKENRVIVEGINMITKHMKAQGPTQQGGIITKEGPINASKVMYYCEKDKTGVRVGHKFLENGSKVRTCKKCGEILDR
ncbi:50S ribosomal protein L24 [Clostridium sp. Cult1]|jgi:large subunit ribosomal protein L24|uniref:50S ribosomal protein L24 n=1 Tax=Clostridium sp. Cult1 TaxID=2079002 RepID=UPI001F00897F|nr:50S ribosomal protein L24 [Clostridium sp. Cult1]MCF6463038.1 50S ribosomal protein L24 [Clostridium sp. Cult1]